MRSLRWLGAAALIMTLSAPEAMGAPRASSGSIPRPTKVRRAAEFIDNAGRMNANNLDMVVTNHGSIAYDLLTGNAGLIFPKGSTHTAVFASGLWVGAKVAGDVRLAVGEYSQEFTPGVMRGGTFTADQD